MAQRVMTLAEPSIDETTRVYRKVSWRLLPFLFACSVAAPLDRVDVGFAELQLLSVPQSSETVCGGAGIAVTNPGGDRAGFASPRLIGPIIDTATSTSLGVDTLAAPQPRAASRR
jgi:hypothetical protein